MNKPAKPATVSFYVDADVLGLAKVLASIRPDVTYPGDPGGRVKGKARPACPITSTATLDTVWIPETARQGWIIITRDRHIQEHHAEIQAVRASGARMVVLAGREAVERSSSLKSSCANGGRLPGFSPSLGRSSLRRRGRRSTKCHSERPSRLAPSQLAPAGAAHCIPGGAARPGWWCGMGTCRATVTEIVLKSVLIVSKAVLWP